MAFWRRPETVDVAFAHAAITGPGGHPVELIEGIAKGGGYPPGTRLKRHAYSRSALWRRWRRAERREYLAQDENEVFIAIVLNFSLFFAARRVRSDGG